MKLYNFRQRAITEMKKLQEKNPEKRYLVIRHWTMTNGLQFYVQEDK